MIAKFTKKPSVTEQSQANAALENLHPAWQKLINHCQKIGYGEIERLKIQDGIPVIIEKTIKRTKLI